MVFRSLSVPSECVGSVLVSFLLFLLEPVAEMQDHYNGCVGEFRKFGHCNSRSLARASRHQSLPGDKKMCRLQWWEKYGYEDQLSSGVYTARHPVLVVVIRILITVTNKSFLPPKALR